MFESRLYFKESDSAKILKIKLSNLPLLPKDEVLAGLKQSLAMFGTIIDVGIATEPNTGLFKGTEYAVLNVQQAANKENKFLELSHRLSWCESDVFHATWQNMPTWCRYCHKEGHTKFGCPFQSPYYLLFLSPTGSLLFRVPSPTQCSNQPA
jgi:hypothetical protein